MQFYHPILSLIFNHAEAYSCQPNMSCIVNIHNQVWGLCQRNHGTVHFFVSPGLTQHSVDMAHSYSCSLIHAKALLLMPYISHNIPLYLCLPHFALSFLLSIPSLADPFIRSQYIGGHPVPCPMLTGCSHVSISPLSNSTDYILNFIHFFLCPNLSCLALKIHPLCAVLKAHYARL